MRRIVLLAAALLPFSAVQAQWLELQPGTKVRVTAPSVLGGRVQATVGMRNADSLSLFRPGSGPFAIPITAIRSAEVSLGKSRAHGALAGLKGWRSRRSARCRAGRLSEQRDEHGG